MATPLRVGILGQGRSGYNIHARGLTTIPELFKIVAVADELKERTEECARDFGATAFTDYRDLLADKTLKLDLIVNALPSFLHPRATIEAFEAGYSVVCEKPLARSVDDYDAMVAAAEKAGKVLLPFQNSRFQPAFQKILSVLESGKLGRLVHGRINFSNFARRWDWQTRRDMWGGNLLNTGPHPMDQAVVLFGDAMPNVFARLVSDNPFGDAENFASVTIWGEKAPTIEVAVSSFQAFPQGEMYNLCCTNGGLSGGISELKWKYFDPSMAPDRAPKGVWSDERGYCGEKLDWFEESWKLNVQSDNFNLISHGFYRNAWEILVNNAPRVVTLDQVRRQIAVMEEAHRQNPNML